MCLWIRWNHCAISELVQFQFTQAGVYCFEYLLTRFIFVSTVNHSFKIVYFKRIWRTNINVVQFKNACFLPQWNPIHSLSIFYHLLNDICSTPFVRWLNYECQSMCVCVSLTGATTFIDSTKNHRNQFDNVKKSQSALRQPSDSIDNLDLMMLNTARIWIKNPFNGCKNDIALSWNTQYYLAIVRIFRFIYILLSMLSVAFPLHSVLFA